jgi:folate-binding protein YgfZ
MIVHSSLRDVVVIEGPEAVAYLQGQISQGVEDMAEGESRWSFCLEPQGKIEGFFRITRIEPDLLIADTGEGLGEAVKASMERFKLGTKVGFEVARRTMVSVREGSASDIEGTQWRIDLGWPGIEGTDLLLHEDAAGIPDSVSDEEWAQWKISHGVPSVGVDIPIGGIPNETGLTELACSFTKGCYRGQELVERIDSRGGQRMVLRRLEAEAGDEAVVAGSAVRDNDGGEVGRVTSTAGDWSLAYVRGAIDLDSVVNIEGGATASVRPLLIS